MSTPLESNTEGLLEVLNAVYNLPDRSTGTTSLPVAMSAMDAGTYTPDTDITSNVTIAHNLGVIPDFVLIYIPGEVSSDAYPGSVIWSTILLQPFSTSTTEYSGSRHYRFYKESTGDQSYGHSNISTYYLSDWLTKDTFAVYASSNAKLKAGVTYRWLAFKFA